MAGQIEKDVMYENSTRIDYDYRVGDQAMIGNTSAYKDETPFKGLHEIIQTWTNRTATLRTGAVTTKSNICRIKPYNNNAEEVDTLSCRKYKHTYITNIYTYTQ